MGQIPAKGGSMTVGFRNRETEEGEGRGEGKDYSETSDKRTLRKRTNLSTEDKPIVPLYIHSIQNNLQKRTTSLQRAK